jgi:hypothetical protein
VRRWQPTLPVVSAIEPPVSDQFDRVRLVQDGENDHDRRTDHDKR